MTGRVVGKTAVITVAAQGIGRASALAMVREGINVIATEVNLGKLTSLRGTDGSASWTFWTSMQFSLLQELSR